MLIIYCIILIHSVYAKEDCDRSTREERCREIFKQIEDCSQESYKTQLMDCLVTCGKCGAFSCNNPQPDTMLNCTALAPQCESTLWRNFMKDKCPATCGKCDLKNANLCKDASNSVICSNMQQFCNSVDYYDQMTYACASTCNRCSAAAGGDKQTSELLSNIAPIRKLIHCFAATTVCTDFARDCASRTALCNNPQYEGLMHRVCAKTCNKCDGCYDYSSRCQTWASHGFCKNKDQNMKMKYCAKTCMLC
ncbi:unnamed protein product [Strongylus vulgaris]|uniref:ShKT domain-containing protein n=1 Tax=Strongylus vulgaris TaxID=40348 RepID=A0A3P7ILC2_STRVU|nr:unnamed protein product [Strongylus vulgaris]